MKLIYYIFPFSFAIPLQAQIVKVAEFEGYSDNERINLTFKSIRETETIFVEKKEKTVLSVFPNPSNGSDFTITSNRPYVLIDLFGKYRTKSISNRVCTLLITVLNP